jgi:hypothetical protein
MRLNKLLFIVFIFTISISCSKDDEVEPVVVDRTLQSALNNGESISSLLGEFSVEEFYGVSYAGGLIFYMDTDSGWGLVAAPNDQHDSLSWWNGASIFVPSSSDLGFGYSNTQSIVDSQGVGGYAAYFCDTMDLNAYSDWYLPSGEELRAMHQNLHENGLGNFVEIRYWSSTDVFASTTGSGTSFPMVFDFSIGVHIFWSKDNFMGVRAARTFNF